MLLRRPQQHASASPVTAFNNVNAHFVSFKHPAYADRSNTLLQLQATDHAPGGGIHHETARIACAIVACNAWNGYLSRSRDGSPLSEHEDDVLREKTYYFHVPTTDDPEPYPICPSFHDWQFPHGDLPPTWRARVDASREENHADMEPARPSAFSAAVLRRDGKCVLSGYSDGIISAHVCPRSEAAWYARNEMTDYNLNRMLSRDVCIDDISNGLLLRADIHLVFDRPAFVIVPKLNTWVAHFLVTTRDLGRLYHNTTIQLAQSVSTEALLARFAWSVFPFAWIAHSGSAARRLRVCIEEPSGTVYRVCNMGIQEFLDVASNRSRSRSPKRRPVVETPVVPESSFCDAHFDYEYSQRRQQSESTRKRQQTPSEPDMIVKRRRLDRVDIPSQLPLSPSTSPVVTAYSIIQKTSLAKTVCIQEDPTSPAATSDAQDEDSFATVAEASPHTAGRAVQRENDFEKLKRLLLLRQRPSDATLYCCNYTDIEADILAGRPGRREYDGGHFCPECLGVEYQEEAKEDIDDDNVGTDNQ